MSIRYFVAHDGEIYWVDPEGRTNFHNKDIIICNKDNAVVELDNMGNEIGFYPIWDSVDHLKRTIGKKWFNELWADAYESPH